MSKKILFRAIPQIILVLFILGAFISQFIVLIIKVDIRAYIPYYSVGIPAFVGYGLGILWSICYIIAAISKVHTTPELVLLCSSLFMVVVGSLISQILLVIKYDQNLAMSMWQSLLPFMISVVIAAILYCASVVLYYIK